MCVRGRNGIANDWQLLHLAYKGLNKSYPRHKREIYQEAIFAAFDAVLDNLILRRMAGLSIDGHICK